MHAEPPRVGRYGRWYERNIWSGQMHGAEDARTVRRRREAGAEDIDRASSLRGDSSRANAGNLEGLGVQELDCIAYVSRLGDEIQGH